MTRPLRNRHRLLIAAIAILVAWLGFVTLASRRPAPLVDRLTIEAGPGSDSTLPPDGNTR